MRVWPGEAGVWPLAFAERDSSGVQFAGNAGATASAVAAGVVAAGVAAALAELPASPEVLVPGLAHAERIHAASVAAPSRAGWEFRIVVTASVVGG
jgi:nucleoid-associated protein YgaU